MIERSYCGSGGCITCPFSFSDEAEQVQNYGCLPERLMIIKMKEKSGHNWSCHYNDKVMCGGYAKYVKEYRPDLNLTEGNLISYETWYQQGEEFALEEANNKSSK